MYILWQRNTRPYTINSLLHFHYTYTPFPNGMNENYFWSYIWLGVLFLCLASTKSFKINFFFNFENFGYVKMARVFRNGDLHKIGAHRNIVSPNTILNDTTNLYLPWFSYKNQIFCSQSSTTSIDKIYQTFGIFHLYHRQLLIWKRSFQMQFLLWQTDDCYYCTLWCMIWNSKHKSCSTIPIVSIKQTLSNSTRLWALLRFLYHLNEQFDSTLLSIYNLLRVHSSY